jgi:hypothetical protein
MPTQGVFTRQLILAFLFLRSSSFCGRAGLHKPLTVKTCESGDSFTIMLHRNLAGREGYCFESHPFRRSSKRKSELLRKEWGTSSVVRAKRTSVKPGPPVRSLFEPWIQLVSPGCGQEKYSDPKGEQ